MNNFQRSQPYHMQDVYKFEKYMFYPAYLLYHTTQHCNTQIQHNDHSQLDLLYYFLK